MKGCSNLPDGLPSSEIKINSHFLDDEWLCKREGHLLMALPFSFPLSADEDEAPQPFFLRQIMSIVDEFGGMERSGSFMISFSDAAIPMKQVP